LSSPELFVFVALCVRAGDKGFCWPSQEKIASDTRLSVRKVRQSTAKLERQGLISVEARQGNKRSKLYTINGPKCQSSARQKAVAGTARVQANTGRFDQNTGTGCRRIPASRAARKNKGKEKERDGPVNHLQDEQCADSWGEERTCKPQQLRELINGLGKRRP
jgi:DNA-binding transcriptional MocR family regulator